MKKKVFRIWKMLLQDIEEFHDVNLLREDVSYLIREPNNWIIQCEGKTKKECRDLGYLINDAWLVEE